MISLNGYLILAALLFCLGLAGMVLHRRNVIQLLISVELMLLGVNTNFVAIGQYQHQLSSQIFVFFNLTVAAAEAAIGLALLVNVFRLKKSIALSALRDLKG